METKSLYRVEVTTFSANPKYIRGSFAASTRHAEIISKTQKHFDTLEEAQAFQTVNGGFIQKLTASGKSYRMIK